MLLRRSSVRLAAAFSSAAFTKDDGGEYERVEKLRRDNNSSSTEDFYSTEAYDHLKRPTRDTYEAMTDDELTQLLATRVEQAQKLRQIYQAFHYEADKGFRTMVLDYHDKAAQLSQVHGTMQQASLTINRETLAKLREEQEMLNRDKRLIFLLCSIITTIFWVWVRRHYVRTLELEREATEVLAEGSQSITGAGSYGGNFFGSAKRSARHMETSWEKEMREKREAEVAEASTRPTSSTATTTSSPPKA